MIDFSSKIRYIFYVGIAVHQIHLWFISLKCNFCIAYKKTMKVTVLFLFCLPSRYQGQKATSTSVDIVFKCSNKHAAIWFSQENITNSSHANKLKFK